MPSSRRLRAAQHLVLVQRVLDDDLEGLLGADQARQQVGPAPAGHEPEEALRQRHRRHARGDRPVRAVQRHLDAAAHRRAVHERERGHRQLAETAEHRRGPAGRSAIACSRSVDQRHAAQVRADREDERLAGHADRDQVVARRDRVQRGVQRGQAAGPERVRLGVVEAVVERDQRHRARAVRQLDVAYARVRDDLVAEDLGDHLAPSQRCSPCSGSLLLLAPCAATRSSAAPPLARHTRSQRTVPPMPMPMHMVVRP